MANQNNKILRIPFLRMFEVIRLKKKEISAIYFFAILYGLLQLSIPLGIQSIINFLQAFTFSTSLWVLIFLVLLGVLLSGALQVSQLRVIERINQQVFSRYGLEFAFRIPKMDMKSVDKYHMPEQVNRFFDTVTIQKGLGKLLLDIPTASIQILFGIILLSFYSQVFIVFGVLLLLILFLIIRFTSHNGLSTSLLESDYKYKMAGWLEEMARAFKTFKFSNLNNLHLKRSDDYIEKYLDARTQHFNVLLVQYWSLIIFKVLITAAMLIVGSLLAINNQINLGQFVAAEIVIIMIIASVEKFIFSLDNVYDLLTSVEKIGKVLDQPLEQSGSIILPASTAGLDIKVNDLNFGFSEDKLVLKNVSFHIPAGAKVCLVGEEGAGKSMLLRMLTGSFHDFSGSILINDIPLNNFKQSTIQQHVGLIINEQDIFQGSLLDNLTMGCADYSFERLTELGRLTELDQFLATLPDGFSTQLDAAGKRLGKSTIQKVLLVRAMLMRPRMLLFENPWSSLNQNAVANLQQYLLQDLKPTTCIIATNDQEYAAKCDFIMVMEKGTVRSFGKPADIIQ